MEEKDLMKNNNDVNNEEEENEENNIIYLEDETGAEVPFEFLDLIEYNGDNYAILLPSAESEDQEVGEVVILKEVQSEEDNEQDTYISVEDENILKEVFNIFKDKFKDEYDFVDDDNSEEEEE